MNFVCSSCSKSLTLPDESLPKNVDKVSVKCPLCQETIQIKLGDQNASTTKSDVAPDPPPKPIQAPEAPLQTEKTVPNGSVPPTTDSSSGPDIEEPLITPLTEDRVTDDGPLAMVCIDDPQLQSVVKSELEALGYTPHIPLMNVESIQQLRQNKYEVIILHEEFGGSVETNLILKVLQPMAMNLRRHICIGLVSKNFITLDPMMAFAKSVNFVISEQDLNKTKIITLQSMTENDRFFYIFRKAFNESEMM